MSEKTVNTLQAVEDQIDSLSNAMILYELNGRGVAPSKTLKRRQSQLAYIIFNETSIPIQSFTPPLETKKDIDECGKIITEIGHEITNGPMTTFRVDQWLNRLEFLSIRLQRLKERLEPGARQDNADDTAEVNENDPKEARGAAALTGETEKNDLLRKDIIMWLDKVSSIFYEISNASYSADTVPETIRNNRPIANDVLKEQELQRISQGNQNEQIHNDAPFGNLRNEDENRGILNTSGIFADQINRFRFDSIAGLNISTIPNNKPGAINVITDNVPNPFSLRTHQMNRANQPENNNSSSMPNGYTNGRNSLDSFSQRPKVPIYKWKVKFSGNTGTISATEFIQQVNELVISRNSSHHEVFLAAPELFEGDGLKWLRTQSDCRNWQQLMQRLVSDFESPDFSEDLLDYIKNRKQHKYERVIIFITNMENMFLKLGQNAPCETERCRIIQRNLLPDYVKHLSLLRFDKISSLKESCKDIESSYQRAEKYESTQKQYSEKLVRFSNDARQSRYDDHYGRRENYAHRSPSFDRRSRFDNNGSYSRSPSASNNSYGSDQLGNSRSHSPYSSYNNGSNRNQPSHSFNDNNRNQINSNGSNRGYSPNTNFKRNEDSKNNQGQRRNSNDRLREYSGNRSEMNSGNASTTTRQGFPVSQSPNRSPKRQ